MDHRSLNELAINELARIKNIENPVLEQKMATIGCHIGDVIQIQHRAPFGDPLIMRSESGYFSIRKEEATKIEVVKIIEEMPNKTRIPA